MHSYNSTGLALLVMICLAGCDERGMDRLDKVVDELGEHEAKVAALESRLDSLNDELSRFECCVSESEARDRGEMLGEVQGLRLEVGGHYVVDNKVRVQNKFESSIFPDSFRYLKSGSVFQIVKLEYWSEDKFYIVYHRMVDIDGEDHRLSQNESGVYLYGASGISEANIVVSTIRQASEDEAGRFTYGMEQLEGEQ